MTSFFNVRYLRGLARTVIGGALVAASVQASASLVVSRAALSGNDFIDWSQLGPTGTSVANPSVVTSSLGLIANVANPNGGLLLFTQGDEWGGNFATGDRVLFTEFAPGPITIDFASGLSRVGAQIQSNTFGAFSGTIMVFNALDILLESYTVAGNSSGAGDNSAIFMGVSRLTADIGRVAFNAASNADFAINRVDLSQVVDGGNAVPEPTTLAMVGLALAALARTRRRAEN